MTTSTSHSPRPTRDYVLGLFAKWPEPGQVKTRLAADTSPEFACAVADALLDDALALLAAAECRRVLAFSPPESAKAFAARAAGRCELAPQCAGDLGARLAEFFAARFQEGAKRVVVIGTDSPLIGRDHIRRAFEALSERDIVIGPAADGGYYLIGGTPRLPLAVFQGIDWSTRNVLAQTVARRGSATLDLLETSCDVDTLADWRVLCRRLKLVRAAGIDPQIPRTEQLARESSV